jgi:hypothetical protein
MTGYNEHGVRYVVYLGRKYTIIRDGRDRLMWSHTNLSHLHVERGHVR